MARMQPGILAMLGIDPEQVFIKALSVILYVLARAHVHVHVRCACACACVRACVLVLACACQQVYEYE